MLLLLSFIGFPVYYVECLIVSICVCDHELFFIFSVFHLVRAYLHSDVYACYVCYYLFGNNILG